MKEHPLLASFFQAHRTAEQTTQQATLCVWDLTASWAFYIHPPSKNWSSAPGVNPHVSSPPFSGVDEGGPLSTFKGTETN